MPELTKRGPGRRRAKVAGEHKPELVHEAERNGAKPALPRISNRLHGLWHLVEADLARK